MNRQDRLSAHRVACRERIEKWLAVWIAMHPEEALGHESKAVGVRVAARELLDAMTRAERQAEAERLDAIPTLSEED